MKRRWWAMAVLAMLLPSMGAVADQRRTDPQAPVVDKPGTTLTPRDMNEREQEYFSDLQKCEPLAEKDREDCVKALKTKYGVM
jgi:hypothetical protein